MDDLETIKATLQQAVTNEKDIWQELHLRLPMVVPNPIMRDWVVLHLRLARCYGEHSGLLSLIENNQDYEMTLKRMSPELIELWDRFMLLAAEAQMRKG